jgi:hypothetical protein
LGHVSGAGWVLRNRFGGLDCDPATPAKFSVENEVTSIINSVEDVHTRRET